MISQMDKIYANSFLTIIAAAGDDAQTGLPGVTNVRRKQREVCIQDVTLLELPDTNGDIFNSTWASRGWTYQECYLSTRRLVFTANDTVFLCNGICVRESVKVPVVNNFEIWSFRGIIPRFSKSSRRFSVEHLQRHIEDYTGRRLSYDSDSLNAILGVLNYYGRSSVTMKTRIVHLSWGLTADQHSNRPHIWNVHLLWYHKSPSLRRPEFPSWAWTGWSGPVRFMGSLCLESGAKGEGSQLPAAFDWRLAFEMEDHSKVDITRFASDVVEETRKGKQPSNQLGPRQLSISCLVVHGHSHEVELLQDQKNKRTKVSTSDSEHICNVENNIRNAGLVILNIWKGVDVCVEAHFDLQLENQECILGLLVGNVARYQPDGAPEYTLNCLLVRPRNDGYYERVGLTRYLPPYAYGRRGIFLDTDGDIMDEVALPGWYPDAAEQMTIRLV